MMWRLIKSIAIITLSLDAIVFVDAAKNNLFSAKQSNKQCAFVEHVQYTLGSVNSFYQNFPIASAFLTCGVKASAADFLAQLSASSDLASASDETTSSALTNTYDMPQKSLIPLPSFEFEVPRNMAFLLYGACYQGVFQYYLYNQWFPQIFGKGNSLMTVTAQVVFDSAVIVPLICLPIAYLTKSTVSGQTMKEGLQKYVYDMKYTSLMAHFCVIWIPAKFLAFGVVPQHLRIAFFAFISFFWMIILSTIASASADDNVQRSR